MHVAETQSYTTVPLATNNNQQSTKQSSFEEMFKQEQNAMESVNSENSIETLFGIKPNANGSISIKDIELAAYEDLDAFTSKFNALLAQNGIDTTQKIELGHEPGSGKVIVKNDHPDKEKIEALFEDAPSLRNEYTKITSMLNLVEAAKRSIEFQRAYAIDPEQAVKDFAYIWQTHMDVSISFENGGYEVSAEQGQNSPWDGCAKFTPAF